MDCRGRGLGHDDPRVVVADDSFARAGDRSKDALRGRHARQGQRDLDAAQVTAILLMVPPTGPRIPRRFETARNPLIMPYVPALRRAASDLDFFRAGAEDRDLNRVQSDMRNFHVVFGLGGFTALGRDAVETLYFLKL
jgi:hypothetical protein